MYPQNYSEEIQNIFYFTPYETVNLDLIKRIILEKGASNII